MSSLSWKITNATSAKPKNLVLINVTTDEILPAVFFYEQNLSLIQPSSTITSVKPGEYQTFAVPDAKKDSAGNPVPYTFILAVAETLAPIASITSATAAGLADLTVTDAMVTSINNVVDFIQNITAFPTSDLAVDFATVIDGGTESEIHDFFTKTKGYTTVKIDDVHLVQSYYKALPYGWADGKDTKIYLYSTDYKNNTDTDEPIGELNITNDWSLPLTATLDASKFVMTLTTYDDKNTTSLVFKDGVFWDSISTDTPKIALMGSFIMPSQLTQDNSRNNVEAYLLGNMYGYLVFGFNEKAPHDQDNDNDDPNADGGFMDVFAVHNFKEGLDLAMYFVTIAMGIGFLVGLWYAAKYVKNKFTSDDALETIKKAEEIKEFIRQSNNTLAAKVGKGVRTIVDRPVGDIQAELQQRMIEKGYSFAKNNLQDMILKQNDSIQALGNRHAGGALQDVLDGLEVLQNRIDANQTRELVEGNVMETLKGYNNIINQQKTAVNGNINAAQKKAFSEAQKAYDESLAIEKVNEERLKEWERGEDEIEVEENLHID